MLKVVEGNWWPATYAIGLALIGGSSSSQLLLGRSKCLQIRSATETLDPVMEVIDHVLQAMIFRYQLSNRALQG
jgi:hypothetical protein